MSREAQGGSIRVRTTVKLTHEQRFALYKLQSKRTAKQHEKPTFNDLLIEGLEMLFKKEKV